MVLLKSTVYPSLLSKPFGLYPLCMLIVTVPFSVFEVSVPLYVLQ